MIEHNQVPSSTINLSDLAFADNAGVVSITGTALLYGVPTPVSFEGVLADGETLFLAPDGTIATELENPLAHLAWREIGDLHIIDHNPPESTP